MKRQEKIAAKPLFFFRILGVVQRQLLQKCFDFGQKLILVGKSTMNVVKRHFCLDTGCRRMDICRNCPAYGVRPAADFRLCET